MVDRKHARFGARRRLRRAFCHPLNSKRQPSVSMIGTLYKPGATSFVRAPALGPAVCSPDKHHLLWSENMSMLLLLSAYAVDAIHRAVPFHSLAGTRCLSVRIRGVDVGHGEGAVRPAL